MKVNGHGQSTVISIAEKNLIFSHLEIPYRVICELAWYTSERPGAIIQLKQKEVYVHHNTPYESITYKAITRKQAAGKKAKTRQVMVHPNLKQILQAYPLPQSVWMFPSPTNFLKHITYQALDYQFRKALKKVKLHRKGISLYSLRRSSITLMAQAGIPLRELKQITGHQSIESLAFYIESDPELERRAILSLG